MPELYAQLMLNHRSGTKNVTNQVYVQYAYDFEKRRAINVWEFVLDQILECECIEDIPALEEMRRRVEQSGLLYTDRQRI